MKCPYCFNDDTKVLDSRDAEEEAVRRRRECDRCGKRFTTYERAEIVRLIVIKKNNEEEAFDKNKLRKGIEKACEKRDISQDVITGVVNDLEMKLRKRESTRVKSTTIGEMVMKKLRKLDEVAYIRFASVYRSFDDKKSFVDEIKLLSE